MLPHPPEDHTNGLARSTIRSASEAAETIDKLTFLTFSGRVQIPGAQLNAGTYRFHLTNPNTDRNVIQVMSRDGGKG